MNTGANKGYDVKPPNVGLHIAETFAETEKDKNNNKMNIEDKLQEILKRVEKIDQTLSGELEGGFASIPPTPDPNRVRIVRNSNCKGCNYYCGIPSV